MDENNQSSSQVSPENPQSGKKIDLSKFLIGLGIFLFVLVVGGISFFIGRQNSEDTNLSPTPPSYPSTIQQQIISPSPSPALTPTSTPSATPTPKILSKTLSSDAGMDGFESSNGGGNTALDIRAGRNANLVTRGFVSFNLSSIPEKATITQATLRLYQTKTVGNPYTAGGSLLLDHLNYGDTLENGDYGSPALLSGFATLTTNAAVEWKEKDVTKEVKDDVENSRKYSQFRIHFNTESKGGSVEGDFAYIESANNSEGTGNTPQLVIKYQ